MISCRLYGRLGNTMMQMAATIGLAKKFGHEYFFPNDTINPKEFKRYFTHLPSYIGEIRNPIDIREESHGYNDIIISSDNYKFYILDGYWQVYKYWYKYIHEIRNSFGLNYKTNLGAIGIHWRFGDYRLYPTKHPIMTYEYMRSSINYILHNTKFNRFIFFSDEIAECEKFVDEEFRIRREQFSFSKNNTELEDFESLMQCQNQIISNSSFSLMAALLNPYPEKIVISPRKEDWYGIENRHLNTDDMIPNNFIKMSQ